MVKKKTLYKSGLEKRLSSISIGLFVVCLSLLSGSCDRNILPEDNDGGVTTPVALHFSTSVEKLLSAVDTRSATPMAGTDFEQGESEFGMYITRNSIAGGDVFPGSADNMKAILTRETGHDDDWKCYQKGGTLATPEGYVGKNIIMAAYYPYNPNATISGIPFNFRDVTHQNQTDLLYNQNTKIKIPDGGVIGLSFVHAYTYISLQIRKTVAQDAVSVSSASIINQTGTWIKNVGYIDPVTGYPTVNSTPGDITDATETLIEKSAQYNFMVPAFMDKSVKDGDVAFRLLVNGKETVFALKREHLNKLTEGKVTKYGFQQGCKNLYNLTYDNLSASLQLRDWTTVEPEVTVGVPEFPTDGYEGWVFDYDDIDQQYLTGSSSSVKPVTDHRYEDYLLDISRGNNGEGKAMWLEKYDKDENFNYMWQVEAPRSPIEFAMSDVISTTVSWKDKNGVMLAKNLCKNYREGGYSNWRLPRMSEWFMFERRIQTDNKYLYYPQKHGGTVPSQYYYWSGTENGSGPNVLVVKLTISQDAIDIDGDNYPFDSQARVRCVRDVDPVTK